MVVDVVVYLSQIYGLLSSFLRLIRSSRHVGIIERLRGCMSLLRASTLIIKLGLLVP